jgi:thioredoxin 1
MNIFRRFVTEIKKTTDFSQAIAKGTSVVDFYATWCGPCKMLDPILEKVVQQPGTGINLVKVDIDAMGDLASQYQVTSVPTVMLFRDGKAIKQFIGVREEAFVKEFIQVK